MLAMIRYARWAAEAAETLEARRRQRHTKREDNYVARQKLHLSK